MRKYRIKLSFLWYDFWIGAYYDRTHRALYVCPLPMCVIKIWKMQQDSASPKKQVIVIHGGTSAFEDYKDFVTYLREKSVDIEKSRRHEGWKVTLRTELGEEYDVVYPSMPNRENAHYAEWKIWFEKYIPYMQDGVILVGHSLGGIFLVKYLSEERFPKKIQATFLVAAPFDTGGSGKYVRGMGEFSLPASLEKLGAQGGDVFFYHSKDDPIVSFSEFTKYRTAVPTARFREFETRKHFNGSALPEIVSDIRALKLPNSLE